MGYIRGFNIGTSYIIFAINSSQVPKDLLIITLIIEVNFFSLGFCVLCDESIFRRTLFFVTFILIYKLFYILECERYSTFLFLFIYKKVLSIF